MPIAINELPRQLNKIGEDISEQLEYFPASMHIIEHARFKYACPQCAENVVIAPKPQQPIDKGLPGPGLLAYIATSKYGDHFPLHRLEHILKRQGVEIKRSTMSDWMAATAQLLQPMWNIMKERLLKSTVIHTDDTVLPVLDKNLKKLAKAEYGYTLAIKIILLHCLITPTAEIVTALSIFLMALMAIYKLMPLLATIAYSLLN